MAGFQNDDLDSPGMSSENLPANEESFESAYEDQSHSGSEIGDDIAEQVQRDDGVAKSLSKDLADCSITPDTSASRRISADEHLDESMFDDKKPEGDGKENKTVEPGDRPASGRPKFSEMILEAVVSAEPSRSGVSVQQIKKLIHQKYPYTANKSDVYFRNGLKRLVDTDMLIQVTGTGASGSYKLVKPDKPDKTKAALKSKAPALSTKAASKVGPKSATAGKLTEAKTTSSAKSPMKKSGKSTSTKVAVSKTSVSGIKSASVRLTKLSTASKSKIIPSKAALKSGTVSGTAKPRGRQLKQTDESSGSGPETAALKSPGSKSKVAASISSVLSNGSAKRGADSAKSPAKPKSGAPKYPKPKSVVPKSPKPKSVAPKSPKPKSVAPKSPKPKSVTPKSPTRRAAASKAKLDSVSNDTEKSAPGPASKRGKKC